MKEFKKKKNKLFLIILIQTLTKQLVRIQIEV